MDKNWLIDRLRDPQLVQKGDERVLRELIAEWPWFPAPYLLLGKALNDQKHHAFDDLLPLISLRAQNRKLLYRLIHETGPRNVPESVPGREPVIHSEQEERPVQVAESEAVVAEEPPQEVPVSLEQERTETPEAAPLFQVDFAEIEKENLVDHSQARLEELPEIPFQLRDSLVEEPEAVEESSHEPVVEISAFAPDPEVPEAEASEEFFEDTHREKDEPADFYHWLDRLKRFDPDPVTTLPDEDEPIEAEGESLKEQEAPAAEQSEIATGEGSAEHPETAALIDRFIELQPRITRVEQGFYNPAVQARESEQFQDDFATETLARIFAAQGKIDRAIAIYEKLQLKLPQKSDYFAALIEELKLKTD